MSGILQHMDHPGGSILLPLHAVGVVALPCSCARGITDGLNAGHGNALEMALRWLWRDASSPCRIAQMELGTRTW